MNIISYLDYNKKSINERNFPGKFKFNEMKHASELVPPMFFVFVVCNSWVLVNLLLTLIIKSFEQVIL